LGGKTFTLKGRNVAEEIVNFVRQRNITRIIAGKPRQSLWESLLFRSPVEHLLRISGEIDVYVIAGEPGEQRGAISIIRPKIIRWPDYGTAFFYCVLANLLCFLIYPHFGLSNFMVLYLLGAIVTAIDCGRGPAILVSLLSVLAFDFFFVPPRFTFAVDDPQYLIAFAAIFVLPWLISHLITLMRQQAEAARIQERQVTAMHSFTRQLANAGDMGKILHVLVQHISAIFDCKVVALLPGEKGKLKVAAGDLSTVILKDVVKELSAAQSAYEAGQMAGVGQGTSRTTQNLYVPLQVADSTLGILLLKPTDPERFFSPERLDLLESLAKQAAWALKVERLTVSGVSP
jgi:two-component system sensor histidine kinase KdpD